MQLRQRKFLLILYVVGSLSCSGCSLLKLPGTLVKSSFDLVGKIIGVANKLPKPPPWVFL